LFYGFWTDTVTPPPSPETGEPWQPEDLEDQGVHAGAIKRGPVAAPEVAHSLLVEHGVEGALWPKPQLAWTDAMRDSADAQELWHFTLARFRVRVVGGAEWGPPAR
jgi:hypothetical protein